MTLDRPPPPSEPSPRINRFFVGSALLALALLAVVVPFALYGSYRGLQAMNNHPLSWMPKDTPSSKRYQDFVDHFEHYDPVIVSWEGCTIDDDRLDRFARRLRSFEDEGGDAPEAGLFHRVVTGRDLLRELTSRPLRLSRAAAISRLQGSLIGRDRRSTCAVVVLTPGAARRSGEALDVIYDVARTQCDLSRAQLRLGGPAVESAELDEASVHSLIDNIVPSAFAVVLVALPFLRSLWLTVLVLVAAMSVESIALALVYYSGADINGILVVMPSLLFVIFVAGAVHLLNYYDDALAEVGPVLAPGEAIRVGWLPCTLAALTTAVGTASLMSSGIRPVVTFAMFSTIGIVLAVAVLFLVLPGAMVVGARRRWLAIRYRARRAKGARRRPTWKTFARLVVGGHVIIVAVFLLGMGWGAAGLWKLKASMGLGDFFAPDTKIVQDHEWLETTLGPLLPAEVVLRFGDDTLLGLHDRLVLVGQIEKAIKGTNSAGAGMSAATLLPSPARGNDARAIARRIVLERKLGQRVDELIRGNYLGRDGDDQLWRISSRVYALSESDYSQSLDELRSAVDGTLADRGLTDEDVTVTYTGLLPLIVESRMLLLMDLAKSFALALLTIAVVLAIAFRSVGFGLLSLLPNVFPTLLVFGALGWMGWRIDIGSMMTASVGLGIAVDDTVHFLTWYRRGIAAGQTPAEAVLSAYRRCGRAMVRTTLICGAGLIVFVISPFLPAAQFALMICVLLGMSLLGDLVFLPALLCLLGRRSASRATEQPPRAQEPMHSPDMH